MAENSNFFTLISQMDKARNPFAVAFEEIKGSKLAEVFIRDFAKATGKTLDEAASLAEQNVSAFASFYTSRNKPGSQQEQFNSLMRPWREAGVIIRRSATSRSASR